MATLPSVGDCKPANIFNRVLLPAPFLPTKAIRSFLLTTNVTSANNGLAANSTCKCSTEIKTLSSLYNYVYNAAKVHLFEQINKQIEVDVNVHNELAYLFKKKAKRYRLFKKCYKFILFCVISCICYRTRLSLHRVFHSIRFKVTKGWVKALTLFLCPGVWKMLVHFQNLRSIWRDY